MHEARGVKFHPLPQAEHRRRTPNRHTEHRMPTRRDPPRSALRSRSRRSCGRCSRMHRSEDRVIRTASSAPLSLLLRVHRVVLPAFPDAAGRGIRTRYSDTRLMHQIGHSFVVPMLVVLVALAIALMTSSCSDDSPSACEDLRDELESLTPPPTSTAWQDIEKLRVYATRSHQLRAEIAARCK